MQLASMAAPAKRMLNDESGSMRRTRRAEPSTDTADCSVRFIDDLGVDAEVEEEEDPLQRIVALQTFEGFRELERELLVVVGVRGENWKRNGNGNGDLFDVPEGLEKRMWATFLAVTFLEVRMGGEREAWEMVVEKAKGWLVGVGVGEGEKVEGWWRLAKEFVGGGGGGGRGGEE